jgi:hypothetical protein
MYCVLWLYSFTCYLLPSPSLSFYCLLHLALSSCWFSFSMGISLKVLWKRPVSATYLKRAHWVLGVLEVSSFVMSMFLLLVLLYSICQGPWWAGQVGESFLMQCRCLANGMCPVHSLVRMLASFLGRPVMSVMYLLDGVFRLVFFILLYLGDFSHIFCV